MKKKSIGELYAFTMGANLFMMIICFAGVIVLLKIFMGSIHTNENNIEGVFGIVAALAVLFVGLYSLQHIIVLLKDYAELAHRRGAIIKNRCVEGVQN